MNKIHIGRTFRRMGLPFWTFVGIGVSGVVVTYVGMMLEAPIKAGLTLVFLPWAAQVLSALILLLLALGAVFGVATWQNARYRSHSPFGLDPLPRPEGKRGLILLVSRVESAQEAIDYHYSLKGTLEQVWLIPSNDLESEKFGASSQPIAEKIGKVCKEIEAQRGASKGSRSLEVRIMPGVSPADAQDTFDLVNRIYRHEARRLEMEPGDVVADFTGGTKPMSVGMIMACLPSERSLEYIAFNPITKTMSGPFLIDYQHSAFDLVG